MVDAESEPAKVLVGYSRVRDGLDGVLKGATRFSKEGDRLRTGLGQSVLEVPSVKSDKSGPIEPEKHLNGYA